MDSWHRIKGRQLMPLSPVPTNSCPQSHLVRTRGLPGCSRRAQPRSPRPWHPGTTASTRVAPWPGDELRLPEGRLHRPSASSGSSVRRPLSVTAPSFPDVWISPALDLSHRRLGRFFVNLTQTEAYLGKVKAVEEDPRDPPVGTSVQKGRMETQPTKGDHPPGRWPRATEKQAEQAGRV